MVSEILWVYYTFTQYHICEEKENIFKLRKVLLSKLIDIFIDWFSISKPDKLWIY